MASRTTTVGTSSITPLASRPVPSQVQDVGHALPHSQTTPKQSTHCISPVHTQLDRRGRSYSVPASKVIATDGGAKTGQAGINRIRTQSLEDWRHFAGKFLNCVPEDAEMSAEQTTAIRRSETSPVVSESRMTRYYGTTSVIGFPTSLEMYNDDELSEEEEECLLDEELSKSGLYRGNYKNIVLLYTFVPLTTLLAFVILSFLPVFAFHSSAPSAFPYPPYLPFPLPEVFIAAAFWSLSYLLRDILYEASSSLTSWIPVRSRRFPNFIPFLTSLLAAILQNTFALVLRQLTVPILLIPLYSTERPRFDDGGLYTAHPHFPSWEDGAFNRVWWIALGWAAAEAVVGIKQGYENIALYKDVLVNVHKTIKEDAFATNLPTSNTDGPTGVGHAGTSNRDPAAQNFPERTQPLADSDTFNIARRRDPSNSFSSIGSGDERQPLLTLRRQPGDTFGPATGLGSLSQDADRVLVESIVEQDLEELIRLKSREEIEELYGMSVIRIPVFISCLHRINSILASLAGCLLLTAAYMRSTFAYDYSHEGSSPSRLDLRYLQPFFPPSRSAIQSSPSTSGSTNIQHPFTPSNQALVISFTVLLWVHTMFSVLHAPWILPRIGVHTFVYVSVLGWLGLFFGALGFWEALS